MFTVKMLASVALIFVSSVGVTIGLQVNEDVLCQIFNGTFKKTARPQTLKMYSDFVPSKLAIGREKISIEENDCASDIKRYTCRRTQVHEAGFWRFEIDDVVTSNVDSVVLSGHLEDFPTVALQPLPLADKSDAKILLQSSAPFVLCPNIQQKGVAVDFVFPANMLDKSVKVLFYMDQNIQCEIGRNQTRECENIFYDDSQTHLTVSFNLTRFEAPNKRYRTLSAVIAKKRQEKVLTKIVDFGSTVWDPVCEKYDGTFSFAKSPTNVTAYLPFSPKQIAIGHNFTFDNGRCESENEVLKCTQTKVLGTNLVKFEIYNVSRRDIETIQFFNSDPKHPHFYILYREQLTDVEQFLFSPKYSAPFVHCPSPSSSYVDISCATKHKSLEGLRVLDRDSVLCEEKYNGNAKCPKTKNRDRTIVHERVFKTHTTNQFEFITCEMTINGQKGRMTHLIDFGRKDAYEIAKDDIEETWSGLSEMYNGTYQLNSKSDTFLAFMDFKPKALNKYTRMDGEYCYYGGEIYSCKIRKVIGSSFWRVDIHLLGLSHTTKLTFKDDKDAPTREYAMYSTPFSEITEGYFLRNLSQPFVHDTKTSSKVSIICAFRPKTSNKRIPFKVYTRHRTICTLDPLDPRPCENVLFDREREIVTVTVTVYRGDINEERYGIFTCEYDESDDLHHLVDFGPKLKAA